MDYRKQVLNIYLEKMKAASEVNMYNRDPRIRAREEDREKLKTENERLMYRIVSLEAENKRLKDGKTQVIVQHQMKQVTEQMAMMEMQLQSKENEITTFKGRIGDLIKANTDLQVLVSEYERGKPPPRANPAYSLNQMTSSAVGYALDEYRRRVETREKEIESKMCLWQEKADGAMEEIRRLRDELEMVKGENESLRRRHSTSSNDTESASATPPDDTFGRDLPFRKRFKRFN